MSARAAAVLASVAVLSLSACGGDSGEAAPASPPPPPATTPTPQPPPPPPPAEPAKPKIQTVRIVVRGGKVSGGLRRVTVKQGEKVVLVVGSDVADHVHLHGYDKFADVAPGKAARIVFVASIPGRFEVELEERGLQIADVEVRP